MRTTLDIDDEILTAAKELALREGATAGKVISDLARKGLISGRKAFKRSRTGFPLLPSNGSIVTLEMVRKAMDEEGV